MSHYLGIAQADQFVPPIIRHAVERHRQLVAVAIPRDKAMAGQNLPWHSLDDLVAIPYVGTKAP